MSTRGKLIVLEGLDGSGTTSMTKELVDHYKQLGFSIQSSREPYSPELEPLLRKFITGEYSDPGWRPMSLLFSADRLMHCRDLDEVLEGGMNVVCDRYIGSTAAYQSAMAPIEERRDAQYFITELLSGGMLIPDLTIFIRASVKSCIARRELVRSSEDYYERVDFQFQVEKAYDEWLSYVMPKGKHGMFVVVDGERAYPDVADDCKKAAELVLEKKCC